ncbi:MAG: D-fructose 1,6-bisphosphatase [Euryarchaeota archaeon]|nr:D-fructose 1,6-bisphosphatase [Euryarchaeota archaeon]
MATRKKRAEPGIDLSELRKVMVRSADAVSRIVKKTPSSRFEELLGMGADGTPTKFVDKLAEDEILRVVKDSGLPVDVVSEEVGLVKGAGGRAGPSEAVLVLDPIDGTTNAFRGIPFFCVSLAAGLSTTDDVFYGLVRNIPTGDTFEAIAGEGANLNGHRIRTRKYPKDDVTVSVVMGRRHDPNAEVLSHSKFNVRSLGAAALELCVVASGGLDAYYHGGNSLRVTDLAAGVLILREAGGEVYDGTGAHLAMELSLKPRTTLFAVGDKDAKKKLGVTP